MKSRKKNEKKFLFDKEAQKVFFSSIIDVLKSRKFIDNQNELTDTLLETEQGITDIKSGKKKLRFEHLILLFTDYPFLNKEILSGEGEVNKRLTGEVGAKILAILNEYFELNYDKEKGIHSISKNKDQEKGIPFYDITASAGPVTMYNDLKEYIVDYLHFPGFEDCDFSVKVWGDSMAGVFENGEYILCKEVEDKTMFLPGSPYYIITREYKTVKFLRKGSKEGFVILRSANTFYEDVEISMDDIYKLYQVKGTANIKRIAN